MLVVARDTGHEGISSWKPMLEQDCSDDDDDDNDDNELLCRKFNC